MPRQEAVSRVRQRLDAMRSSSGSRRIQERTEARWEAAPPSLPGPPEPPSESFLGRVHEFATGLPETFRESFEPSPWPGVSISPPMLSQKGRENIAPALPAAFATVGGMLGGMTPIAPVTAPLGAGVGGAIGEWAKIAAESEASGEPMAPPMGAWVTGLGWEGVKQAGYELGARILAPVVGRVARVALRRGPVPQPFRTIGGETFELTAGQAYGKQHGYLRQLESYLSGAYMGGPLQEVATLQENASRRLMSRLARTTAQETADALAEYGGRRVNPASFANILARNWDEAREATWAMAGGMYDQLPSAPVEGVLARALGEAGGISDEVAKVVRANPVGTTGDVLKLRQQMGRLAAQARRTGKKPEEAAFWQARETLTNALSKQLDPQQMTILAVADREWHRGYLMDEMASALADMERSAPVGVTDAEAIRDIVPGAFRNFVHDLVQVPVGHTATETVTRSTKLERLFSSAGDQRAVRELADFLMEEYDKSGITEKLARIGLTLELTSVPIAAVRGPGAVQNIAAHVAGLTGLTHLLAKPGGAKLVLDYFKAPAAEIGPVLARLAEAYIGDQEQLRTIEPFLGQVPPPTPPPQ